MYLWWTVCVGQLSGVGFDLRGWVALLLFTWLLWVFGCWVSGIDCLRVYYWWLIVLLFLLFIYLVVLIILGILHLGVLVVCDCRMLGC